MGNSSSQLAGATQEVVPETQRSELQTDDVDAQGAEQDEHYESAADEIEVRPHSRPIVARSPQGTMTGRKRQREASPVDDEVDKDSQPKAKKTKVGSGQKKKARAPRGRPRDPSLLKPERALATKQRHGDGLAESLPTPPTDVTSPKTASAKKRKKARQSPKAQHEAPAADDDAEMQDTLDSQLQAEQAVVKHNVAARDAARGEDGMHPSVVIHNSPEVVQEHHAAQARQVRLPIETSEMISKSKKKPWGRRKPVAQLLQEAQDRGPVPTTTAPPQGRTRDLTPVSIPHVELQAVSSPPALANGFHQSTMNPPAKEKTTQWLRNVSKPTRRHTRRSDNFSDDEDEYHPDNHRELTVPFSPDARLPGKSSGTFTRLEKDAADHVFEHFCQTAHIDPNELRRAITEDYSKVDRDFKLQLEERFPKRTKAALRKFCQRRYTLETRGPWAPEEDQQVLAAYAQHPNEWADISKEVGRSAGDCRDRWRNHLRYGTTMLTGPWSVVEERKLVGIVKESMSQIEDAAVAEGKAADVDSDEEVEALINWTTVAERLTTRQRKRCLEKWAQLKKRGVISEMAGDPAADEPAPTATEYAVEEGIDTNTKKQRRIAKDFEKCKEGDYYDALIEIYTAISDHSFNYPHESTVWSIVATKNNESRFSGPLRRRIYYAALDHYGKTKRVASAKGIAARARAMSLTLKKWAENGRGGLEALERGFTGKKEAKSKEIVEESDEEDDEAAAAVPAAAKKRRVSAKGSKRKSEEVVVESDDDEEEEQPRQAKARKASAKKLKKTPASKKKRQRKSKDVIAESDVEAEVEATDNVGEDDLETGDPQAEPERGRDEEVVMAGAVGPDDGFEEADDDDADADAEGDVDVQMADAGEEDEEDEPIADVADAGMVNGSGFPANPYAQVDGEADSDDDVEDEPAVDEANRVEAIDIRNGDARAQGDSETESDEDEEEDEPVLGDANAVKFSSLDIDNAPLEVVQETESEHNDEESGSDDNSEASDEDDAEDDAAKVAGSKKQEPAIESDADDEIPEVSSEESDDSEAGDASDSDEDEDESTATSNVQMQEQPVEAPKTVPVVEQQFLGKLQPSHAEAEEESEDDESTEDEEDDLPVRRDIEPAASAGAANQEDDLPVPQTRRRFHVPRLTGHPDLASASSLSLTVSSPNGVHETMPEGGWANEESGVLNAIVPSSSPARQSKRLRQGDARRIVQAADDAFDMSSVNNMWVAANKPGKVPDLGSLNFKARGGTMGRKKHGASTGRGGR